MGETLDVHPTKIRSELFEIVLKDLRGTANGEEEIITEQTVHDRYVLGLIAPKGHTPLPPDEDEDLASDGTDGEDGVSEPVNIQTRTMLPSSMGMTFTVAPDATEIVITAKWGALRTDPQHRTGSGTGTPTECVETHPD